MSKLEEIKGRLAVKSVKCTAGREGHVYSATIYFDGQRVGTFQDSHTGGPPKIEMTNNVVHKLLDDAAREQAVTEDFTFYSEAAYVENYANGDLLGMIIYPLLTAADLDARITATYKRLCKNKIVLGTDKLGEYTTINLKYDRTKHKAQIEVKYPGREIINERFL